MYLEICCSGFGSCFVCGMVLELFVVMVFMGLSDEFYDMIRCFWLGLLLVFLVLVFEMGFYLFFDLRNIVLLQYNIWLQLFLVFFVVLWCGWLFFVWVGMLLCNCFLNMFIFVVMGIGVVWVYSVIVIVFFFWFFVLFRNMDGLVVVYFEVVVVIMVFVLLGQVFELWVWE